MKQDLATRADQPPQADGPKATRGTSESGFRFNLKSDLRNHQAIVQPRLYDSAMVTQIILLPFKVSLPQSSTLQPPVDSVTVSS